MRSNAELPIATPAVQLKQKQYEAVKQSKAKGDPASTLVTFDHKRNALYFSKSLIPFLRNIPEGGLPVYKHLGIYAYRQAALKQYLELPPGILERAEGLEQLRALEHGIPIRIVLVDLKGRTPWSVDSPEDARMVEEILQKEGEILG
jgi:3-deoxy-manno-octulosonate cytidylyltransferase (CMP-KDO synthetase)